MKKNLRIVSATAAALLAVAPVAATSVASVFAAAGEINVPVDSATQANPTAAAQLNLNVTNAGTLADGDLPSKVAVSISTPSLPTGASVSPAKAQVFEVTGDGNNETVAKTPTTDKLVAGRKYVVKDVVTITGLTALAGKSITVNGSGLDKDKVVSVGSTGISDEITLQSTSFIIPNSTLVGAPYVTEANKDVALSSGSLSLTSTDYSVDGLAKRISDAYTPRVTTNKDNSASSTNATASFPDVKADVRASLRAAGITTKNDSKESFDKPATSFPITLNVVATNGQKTTFVINVDPNAVVADATFPVINYNVKGNAATPFPNIKGATTDDKTSSKTLDNIDDLTFGEDSNAPINFNYVPVNGVVDVNGIKRAFSAQVSTNNTDKIGVDVDVSKVNTKVAGKYPVVVSATNADKKTTKITFMLTVGAKGATYKTVQSNGDIPVYKIDGNTVTDTKTTVKNGDTIAVFGDAIKIGDKSYTRINSADSDLYVESQYVDGSFKPAPTVAKKIMHNSYIYDANHKRVGTNTLAAYTTVNVYGDATKLADGSLVYKIGDNQYVMADNIDGISRTLTHNAYVYKTSTKRADRRVLKKGTKVTTYGAPYKFKNGKSYYRIGGPAKQYVKVANF